MTHAQEVLEIFKSIHMAERNAADAYAGPGKSFPLFSSGAHLHAAWMLAGHASDPSAVRSRIKSFAVKHHLQDRLPEDAFDDASDGPGPNGSTSGPHAKPKAVKPAMATMKADVRGRAARLLEMAFQHESMEGDTPQKHALIDFAQKNGLSDALPMDAHGYMHAHDIPHGHPGDENDGAPSLHDHPVQKAINVVSKSVHIEKAFEDGDGNTVIEGWASTEDRDIEKDVVPPECFVGALDEYMARKAPLSSDHDTRGYPIGHAQRIALVRDGAIFKSAVHPNDAADFEHFPSSGTGMYGRYVITDPAAASAVKKGNVGGFSWIGNLREYAPLPGGGRKFITVDPLRENTIAAYPVNGKAVLTAVKAFEAELEAAQGETMDETLEELLKGAALAVEREERERQTQVAAANGTVSKADLEGLLADFKASLLAEVQKAAVPQREEGAGRRGVVEPSSDPRDADPAAYIVKKAREVFTSKDEDAELSQADKELAWGITQVGLVQGMSEL
jgi:hypothetical protein